MPKPNTQFELTTQDLDLIEGALRRTKSRLCEKVIGQADADARAELQGIHDLLGRLHNQKEFYRPSKGYVSG